MTETTRDNGASEISRRRFAARALAIAIGLAAAGAVTPFRSPEAADDQPARAYIEGLADAAISALTPPGLSREERKARAKELLGKNFAIPTIARFVLGPHARRATPEEWQEYLQLFEELIVVTYVDRFQEYSGTTLQVLRTYDAGDGRDTIVVTQINRPVGDPVEVGWRVRQQDGGFKIIDVLVAGASMSQTQRSEFSAVIQQKGGTVQGLIDEMRRRIRT